MGPFQSGALLQHWIGLTCLLAKGVEVWWSSDELVRLSVKSLVVWALSLPTSCLITQETLLHIASDHPGAKTLIGHHYGNLTKCLQKPCDSLASHPGGSCNVPCCFMLGTPPPSPHPMECKSIAGFPVTYRFLLLLVFHWYQFIHLGRRGQCWEDFLSNETKQEQKLGYVLWPFRKSSVLTIAHTSSTHFVGQRVFC